MTIPMVFLGIDVVSCNGSQSTVTRAARRATMLEGKGTEGETILTWKLGERRAPTYISSFSLQNPPVIK